MGRAGGRAGPQQEAGRAGAPARPVGTTTGGEQLALQGIVGNQALGALLSGGTPLDAVTRAQMEAGVGRDLGPVRVHTDGAAVRSVESVGARAYTVGRHIFLGAEVLQQGNGFVRQLLAHEL